MALDSQQADELRRLAAEVNDAVEARVRGEAGAVERLRRTTQSVQMCGMGSFEYWGNQLWQPLKSICLIMAQEIGVLPRLNAQAGSATAADIARELRSDELLISRLMRVLTSVGIGEETSPNTYLSNEISQIAGSEGGQAGIKYLNELLFSVAARIVPYMREHGFKQFPKRPEEMDPTQYTFGGRMMWDYLKDTPEMKNSFDTLMKENRRGNKPWFTIFPFAEQVGNNCKSPDEVLLVDVGGNRGADILELHKTHPDLNGRLILQDLPETIANVDRSTMHGIELQAYDFFTPQTVKGARAYFWRWILHDWDDSSIRSFLGNTVQAMSRDSRLLIEEFVLPDTGADVKTSHLDIMMMLYHSGMERTLTQWQMLLKSCGVDIVKIWTRPDTDSSVLECRLSS
ncbi:putative O-methyltransferase domain, S-adenosyl-L-methionine-dependent methyltransferase [Septoria linicola]|nr:putative O-methyltransferase domain, S-adenosyl-L-methionine-dependent methyltransferase [Septoria linicola]